MKINIKFILALALFVYVLILPFVSCADDNFKVFSEYITSEPVNTPHFRTWNTVIKILPVKNVVNITIYPENSREAICTIEKIISVENPEIIFRSVDNRTQKVASDLFILPDFPAPCNMLPVHQKENEKIYEQKKVAGGRIFVSKFKVIRSQFTVDTCIDNGWIRQKDKLSGMLTMITVQDEQKRIIIKQLWSENENWWVYEESANRRSWRQPLNSGESD